MNDLVHWYGVKSPKVFDTERCLTPLCESVYLPKIIRRDAEGHQLAPKALIAGLMFIRATEDTALRLEKDSHDPVNRMSPFWIYRNIAGDRIQAISEREMNLFRLLTVNDTTRCEVYRKDDFRTGDRVRIKSGPFEGYTGYARRIRRDKHVVVEIEGICAIALPFIHPDLLEKLPE